MRTSGALLLALSLSAALPVAGVPSYAMAKGKGGKGGTVTGPSEVNVGAGLISTPANVAVMGGGGRTLPAKLRVTMPMPLGEYARCGSVL